MDIVAKAKEFASHAHRDHVRKNDARTPYIHHLEEVAELVRDSGGSSDEIAAAWLHDTVEDTEATLEEIQSVFGPSIGEIVEGVTDLDEWSTLTLQDRKTKQAERIASAHSSIKRVKLADQTSNVRIVGEAQDNFTLEEKFIYIDRARYIAEMCKGASPHLDAEFARRYSDAFRNLEQMRKRIQGH